MKQMSVCPSVRWWRTRTPTWTRWSSSPTQSSNFSSDTRSEKLVRLPVFPPHEGPVSDVWLSSLYFFSPAVRNWGWTSTSRWRRSRNRSRRRLTRTSRRIESSSFRWLFTFKHSLKCRKLNNIKGSSSVSTRVEYTQFLQTLTEQEQQCSRCSWSCIYNKLTG